jgi:hypothetical protein
MHHAQALLGSLSTRWSVHTPRGRRDADRAVTRWVIDPDAPIGHAAALRLRQLCSKRHRSALAGAVRRDTDLGISGERLAPPVAGLLARNCDDADRIAAGLERPDADLRAVIETERLLAAGAPSQERLAWIARLLDARNG